MVRRGFAAALRGRDNVRKFFPSCEVGWGWDKIELYGAVTNTPSFGPALAHFHPYCCCRDKVVLRVKNTVRGRFLESKNSSYLEFI